MTLNQLLLVLRARWRLIAGIACAMTLAVLALNLALPKQYTAQASVLVDTRGFDPMRPIDANVVNNGQASLIATQIDLITSERVARRVVSMLKLDQEPQLVEKWQQDTQGHGDIQNDIARGLLRKLEVLPNRESTVLTIAYTAYDPKFAKLVANTFARAYVDTGLELRVDPAREYASWFDSRRAALRSQLEAAQSKLSAYQQRNGQLLIAHGQVDVENAKLAELSAQLIAIQGQHSESSSRKDQAGVAENSPDVMNNAMIASLRTEVARNEAAVRQMSAQLGPNHPQIQAAQEQLETLKAQLHSEMQAIARTVGSTNSVNERREREMRAALDAQKKRVLELTRGGDDLAVLKRDVETAQHALDVIEARQTQAVLEANLQQTNVSLLSTAVEPSAPARPRVLLNTLVAFFVSLLLGSGVALMQELRNPLIRTIGDLMAVTEAPVLASVSRAKFKASDTTQLLASA